MAAEHGGRNLEPTASVTPLGPRRPVVCRALAKAVGEDADLVPITEVLDERRLSSMASHPSNTRRKPKTS